MSVGAAVVLAAITFGAKPGTDLASAKESAEPWQGSDCRAYLLELYLASTVEKASGACIEWESAYESSWEQWLAGSEVVPTVVEDLAIQGYRDGEEATNAGLRFLASAREELSRPVD